MDRSPALPGKSILSDDSIHIYKNDGKKKSPSRSPLPENLSYSLLRQPLREPNISGLFSPDVRNIGGKVSLELELDSYRRHGEKQHMPTDTSPPRSYGILDRSKPNPFDVYEDYLQELKRPLTSPHPALHDLSDTGLGSISRPFVPGRGVGRGAGRQRAKKSRMGPNKRRIRSSSPQKENMDREFIPLIKDALRDERGVVRIKRDHSMLPADGGLGSPGAGEKSFHGVVDPSDEPHIDSLFDDTRDLIEPDDPDENAATSYLLGKFSGYEEDTIDDADFPESAGPLLPLLPGDKHGLREASPVKQKKAKKLDFSEGQDAVSKSLDDGALDKNAAVFTQRSGGELGKAGNDDADVLPQRGRTRSLSPPYGHQRLDPLPMTYTQGVGKRLPVYHLQEHANRVAHMMRRIHELKRHQKRDHVPALRFHRANHKASRRLVPLAKKKPKKDDAVNMTAIQKRAERLLEEGELDFDPAMPDRKNRAIFMSSVVDYTPNVDDPAESLVYSHVSPNKQEQLMLEAEGKKTKKSMLAPGIISNIIPDEDGHKTNILVDINKEDLLWGAGTRMQRAFRDHLNKREVVERRHDLKNHAAILLQRWFRWQRWRDALRSMRVAATVIQRNYRTYYLSKRMMIIRRSIKLLQKNVRRWLCRYHIPTLKAIKYNQMKWMRAAFHKMRDVTTFTAWVRSCVEAGSNHVKVSWKHACIQRWRRWIQEEHKLRVRASKVIQRFYRRILARRAFRKAVHELLEYARCLRVHKPKWYWVMLEVELYFFLPTLRRVMQEWKYRKITGAATMIQSHIRRYLDRKFFGVIQQQRREEKRLRDLMEKAKMRKLNVAATAIQQMWRGILDREIARTMYVYWKTDAAICIQATIRMFLAKLLYERMQMEELKVVSATIIQSMVRMVRDWKKVDAARRQRASRQAAIRIQCFWRMVAAIKRRDELYADMIYNAAAKVQALVRGYNVRKQELLYRSDDEEDAHDEDQISEWRTIFSKTRHNRYREVEEALEEGTPINLKDKAGNTILHIACQNGLKRIARLALRKGAQLNAQNFRGQTSLHFAYAFGFNSLGEYLVTKGADMSLRNIYGLTPLEGLEPEVAATTGELLNAGESRNEAKLMFDGQDDNASD